MENNKLWEDHFVNKTIKTCEERCKCLKYLTIKFNINLSNIYDIGSNIGIYSIIYALNFPKTQIYSFEPVEETYKVFKKNVKNFNLNTRINSYNYGISINNKEENLYLSISKTRNSENCGLYSLKIKDEYKKDSILCKFIPLSKLNLPQPDFIKIDVEGSEEEIILNNIDFFNKAKIIMIEITKERSSGVKEYIKNNQNIKNVLKKLNFIEYGKSGLNDYFFIKKYLF